MLRGEHLSTKRRIPALTVTAVGSKRQKGHVLLSMSLKTISNYTRQLSSALNAGVPLNRVLATLSRTAPTVSLRAASKAVNQSIASGSTLAQSIEMHSHAFPDFFRKMMRVGEETGRLEQVASSLSSYYEQRCDIARAARHELYRVFAYMVVLMAAIMFIEWITRGLGGLESGSDALAWVALAGIALFGAYYFSRPFRDGVGALMFHLPFVGRLVKKFSLSKFCEGMRLGSEAGLDVNAAIRLSADAAGNAAFRKRALRAIEHIERGATISESLDRTGVFPLEAVQIFVSGEETGRLHEAMAHVSRFTREEALAALRTTLLLSIRALYLLLIVYIAFKVVAFWVAYYSRILGEF